MEERLADFDVNDDAVDAIASVFSWHTLRAIDQGLVRDSVRLEEASDRDPRPR